MNLTLGNSLIAGTAIAVAVGLGNNAIAQSPVDNATLVTLESVSRAIFEAPSAQALLKERARWSEGADVGDSAYWVRALDILVDQRLKEFEQDKFTKVKTFEVVETRRLGQLLDRFAAAYDVGDLTGFMNLFENNAQTNDQYGHDVIRSAYKKLFSSTDQRHIVLRDFDWKTFPDYAQGRGNFEVNVTPQGKRTTKSYTGNILMRINHNAQDLRISELYYSACELDSL